MSTPPRGGAGTEGGRAGAGWLPRGLERVTGALNALGTVWIFSLMVLINVDVFGREALGKPVRGVTEIVSLSIVGIVFLQLAHTLAAGRVTRSDALLARIARAWPQVATGLEALYKIIGAALFAIIFWASVPYFMRALEIGEYVGALGDFTAPTWPVRLIILIGCFATCATFLVGAARDLRRLIVSRPLPHADG